MNCNCAIFNFPEPVYQPVLMFKLHPFRVVAGVHGTLNSGSFLVVQDTQMLQFASNRHVAAHLCYLGNPILLVLFLY
jgi:hypothetical protein